MRKSTSLSATLVITSIVISIVIAYSVGAFAIVEPNLAHNEANENYEAAMYNGYRTEIKSQVQAALAVLQSLYEQEIQGIITTEEAQYQGKETIRKMRYRDDHSGYFWIDDKDYILVMYPVLTHNEGNNRFDLQDQNGVMITQSALKSCLGPETSEHSSQRFTPPLRKWFPRNRTECSALFPRKSKIPIPW